MFNLHQLPFQILDTVPTPILVKDAELRYVWVNRAFEDLFGVDRAELVLRSDTDVFPERQAVQCNGGDLRVLGSGEIDESAETIVAENGDLREVITRKSRLVDEEGEHFLVGVMHDITEVTRTNQELSEIRAQLEANAIQLRDMANRDPLTDCLNRRALRAAFPGLIAQGSGAIVVFDIDHFKQVNDAWGHGVGDDVLTHLCDVVRDVLRPEDQFARLGGEEFAVFLPATSPAQAQDVAERLCAAVREHPMAVDQEWLHTTVSLGLVHHIEGAYPEFADWLQEADRCLYEAKAAGRDRVVSAGA